MLWHFGDSLVSWNAAIYDRLGSGHYLPLAGTCWNVSIHEFRFDVTGSVRLVDERVSYMEICNGRCLGIY